MPGKLILSSIFIAVTSFFSTSALARELLIGTYTDSDSKGIYKLNYNEKSDNFDKPVLLVEARNPSFLALRGSKLYWVEELEKSRLKMLSLSELKAVEVISNKLGDGAAHLSVSPAGDQIAVATYGDGEMLLVSESGDIVRRASIKVSGPTRSKKEMSHAHWVGFSDIGNQIYWVDLGSDTLNTLKIKDGSVETIWKFPDGTGPRHAAYFEERWYVLSELDNTITVLSFSEGKKRIVELQRLSSRSSSAKGTSYGAEIQILPKSRRLYVSNRGDDTIGVYAINADGKLAHVAHRQLEAKWPRSFYVDSMLRVAFVAFQHSDEIRAYQLEENGSLGELLDKANIKAPADILPIY